MGKPTLKDYLAKAVETGAEAIEIEYKDGKDWIFAYHGPMGFGLAGLDSKEAKPLFTELDELKKKKVVTLGATEYRLRFSGYESFGEWVHRIEWKEIGRGSAAKRARK